MNKRLFFLFNTMLYILTIVWLGFFYCETFQGLLGYQCVNGVGSVGPSSLIVFVLIAFMPAFYIPIEGKRASSFVVLIVYFFHVVPLIILTPLYVESLYYDRQIIWVVIVSFVYTIICVIYRGGMRRSLPSLKFSGKLTIMALLLIAVLFVVILIKTYGFTFSVPSFYDVYGTRAEYKQDGNLFSGYAAIIGGYFVSPFLLLIAVRYKKGWLIRIVMVILSLLLSYVIFSNSGIKSIGFIPVGSLILYCLICRVNNINKIFPLAISVFILVNFFVMKVTGFEDALIHWIRRLIMSSGMNVAKFFDYFILKNNMPGGDAPRRISDFYYGTSGSANAGLFGDAIGRYGMHGVLINFVVFLLLLWLLDIASRRCDQNVMTTMSFFVGYAICNSSLLTVIISYGLIFLIFFSYLLRETPYLKEE